MKREGWKHDMDRSIDVRRRTLLHARACSKSGKQIESQQLLLKPTNNSKFTGKCRKARCRSCHYHPVSKAKDKTKGKYKLKSCDVALNHQLVSWRVVDEGSTLNCKGKSATAILGYLSGKCWNEGEEDDDDDDHGIEYGAEVGYGGQFMEPEPKNFSAGCSYANEEIIHESEFESEESVKEQPVYDSEEDDDMGFYKVGIAWEYIDEEGWLVVQET